MHEADDAPMCPPGPGCPLCGEASRDHATVRDVPYFECAECDFIFVDPSLLARMDAGEALRKYDESYWRNELQDAHDRSFGSSLARAAEAILYCRIPIHRFIDIGTGPGHLLDALARHLPAHSDRFFGVEKFPPADEFCTRHPNYLRTDLADVDERFECGVCIEVVEHLTPAMLAGLARALDRVSVPGSLFLFNTGLTDYVRNEDPGYLDFHVRGHVTAWSVTAARRIFGPAGFQVHPVRGKSWAFVVEKPLAAMEEAMAPTQAAGPAQEPTDEAGTGEHGVGASAPTAAIPLEDRIWTPPPENLALLRDPDMGEVMYILGRESARAY